MRKHADETYVKSKRKAARALLFASLAWLASPCRAVQLSFRHYGQAEGLGNLAVLSIAQDSEGFLWAGTEGGLYRYDGTSFRLMGAAEGLPCVAEVHSLHVAADGALWVNTCSRVFRFDGRRFSGAKGVSEMMAGAQAFADSPSGGVLVGAREGLFQLYGASEASAPAAAPYRAGGARPRGLFREGTQLWYGCGDRLCMEELGRVTEFGEDSGVPSDVWNGIGRTPDGTVWIRSSTRLRRKAPGAARFVPLEFDIAPSMYWGALTVANNGRVLVPTDRGLAVYREGRWSVIGPSSGLRSPLVTSALVDRDGSLWVGMAGGGLARCLGWNEWESWTEAQGLPSNLVWSILRDRRGSLWVGTSGGITRLSGPLPLRTWTIKDGLGGEGVRWIGETQDGAIWVIAKPGGLSRIDSGTGVVQLVGTGSGLDRANPERGFVDRAGRLWIAASAGLFRDDSPASSTRFEKVNPTGVLPEGAWWAGEDASGAVYATGQDGFWRLGSTGWRRYGKTEGLIGADPYVAAFAPNGSVWLRHRFEGGIESLEFKGDRLVRATPIERAGSDSADLTDFHGFDAQGGFWRGTPGGVFVLRNGTWTQYTTEDGLVWNDCNGEAFWADSDGSVWFGTSGGLSHFHALQAPSLPRKADPIVSSIQIFKRPRSVRIAFSTLDFRYEQEAAFEYRLDDGGWAATAERSVSIAGISPGGHRVEIRSARSQRPMVTSRRGRGLPRRGVLVGILVVSRLRTPGRRFIAGGVRSLAAEQAGAAQRTPGARRAPAYGRTRGRAR